MRIAIVNSHIIDRIGGSQVQCDLIATALSRRGHDVHYVAVSGGSQTRSDHYRVHPVSASAAAIANQCISVQPDIVYWRYNKKCFFGAARAIAAQHIPIVFSVSHIADTQKWASKTVLTDFSIRDAGRLIRSKIRSRRGYRGFEYVSGVITNNDHLLDILPVERQVHIDNSAPRLTTSAADAALWPRPYCLWVASIKPQKQPERFIELAGRLKSSNVDFLMIGPIQSRDYSYLAADAYGPANFRYLGAKENGTVNAFLQGAMLLVHTCRPEGFPNIFIQAWMHGKPVVSLAFDPEGILERERIGVHSGTFEKFVGDVGRLIIDRETREEMGARGRHVALSKFDLDRNVTKLETFLGETIEQQSERHSRADGSTTKRANQAW